MVGYAPGGPVDAAARLFAPVFAREVGGWYALYGPAKLPADIVARYNDASRCPGVYIDSDSPSPQ